MDPLSLMALVGQCAGAAAVPPALVYAVVEEESGGQAYIVRDNTTGTVHRFRSYSAARLFVKAHARHSLDIGLMQVNTKAHQGNPARLLSPCGNIREGAGILEKDLETSGGALRPTLCLYHRGKRHCGTYPEKVAAFLPGWEKTGRRRSRSLAESSPGIRVASPGEIPERGNSFLDLADEKTETDSTGSDLTGEGDPQFRPADVDGFMGR